jgi:hypothetical protein
VINVTFGAKRQITYNEFFEQQKQMSPNKRSKLYKQLYGTTNPHFKNPKYKAKTGQSIDPFTVNEMLKKPKKLDVDI